MKFLKYFALLTLTFFQCKTVSHERTGQTKTFNGEIVADDSYPNVGAFYTKDGDKKEQFCTGSLLDLKGRGQGRCVLTAGHCVDHLINSNAFFTLHNNISEAADNDGNTTSVRSFLLIHNYTHASDYIRNLKSSTPEDEYNKKFQNYDLWAPRDIMLVYLEAPVSSEGAYLPIDFSDQSISIGQDYGHNPIPMTAIGYGEYSNSETLQSMGEERTTKVNKNSQTSNQIKQGTHINVVRHLAALDAFGGGEYHGTSNQNDPMGGQVCPGDSGGPLIHNNKIIAVSSYGRDADQYNCGPGESRFTSLAANRQWLEQYIERFCTSGELGGKLSVELSPQEYLSPDSHAFSQYKVVPRELTTGKYVSGGMVEVKENDLTIAQCGPYGSSRCEVQFLLDSQVTLQAHDIELSASNDQFIKPELHKPWQFKNWQNPSNGGSCPCHDSTSPTCTFKITATQQSCLAVFE